MAARNKAYLKQEFRDGERPTGTDFADFIDSYVNLTDDGVSVDSVNRNLNIPAGITVHDVIAGPTGTLRFNAGKLQVFDGANWVNVGGAGGAGFGPVGVNSIAFNGTSVGIGNFAVAPTFKFEVTLGPNNAEIDRVRFGNLTVSNGLGAFQNHAQVAHANNASNSGFALRQGPSGDVNLNAPLAQPIRISQGGTDVRIFVAPTTGQVVIGNNALLSATANHMLQVNGEGVKNTGLGNWTIVSDQRFKKDIHDFDDGLEKLLKVRPVRFRYNGRMHTDSDKEVVGIIGQEIQEVFPYMTTQNSIAENGENLDDVLMFNGSALTYVMVNAIKELTNRVKELEAQLSATGKEDKT
jgi:hypothetical protein